MKAIRPLASVALLLAIATGPASAHDLPAERHWSKDFLHHLEVTMNQAHSMADRCLHNSENRGSEPLIVFLGLVDLLSEDPYATPNARQSEARIVLVDTNIPESRRQGRDIALHCPFLFFEEHLNEELGHGPVIAESRTLRYVSLQGLDVRFRELERDEPIIMQRGPARPRQDQQTPGSNNFPPPHDDGSDFLCGLNHLVLGDLAAPDTRLRALVFSNRFARGLRRLWDADKRVNARFVIEQGTAFTSGYFGCFDSDGQNPVPGRSELAVSQIAGYRAYAPLSFSIAVPVEDNSSVVELVAKSSSSRRKLWKFETKEGERAILLVTNMPCADGGEADFSAHFELRTNLPRSEMDVFCTSEAHSHTYATALDPQCMPMDNGK